MATFIQYLRQIIDLEDKRTVFIVSQLISMILYQDCTMCVYVLGIGPCGAAERHGPNSTTSNAQTGRNGKSTAAEGF